MTTPKLELISHVLCPYVQRAVITMLEKDIPHDRTYIDLANKPAWFQQISPLGKVPLLRVGDEILFESAVICEYLDEITPGSLHPADPLEKAKHRAWIEFGSSILNNIVGLYTAVDRIVFEQKCRELADKFRSIEQVLKAESYFAGDRFSLVDAVYGPIFRYFDVLESIDGIDFDFFANTPKIATWRKVLRLHPSVKNAVVADYHQRLKVFFHERNSYLSTLI
jgi:glutathione S-transferase